MKAVTGGQLLSFLLGLASLLGAAAPVCAGQQPATFAAQGNFAEASLFQPTSAGYNEVFVYVSQGGPNNAPQTFLEYDLVRVSNGALTEEDFGYGTVPNSSLTVNAIDTVLTLDIDLGTLSAPAFSQFIETPSTGCILEATPGAPSISIINLTWTKTAQSWSRFEGHTLGRFGDFLFLLQGTSASFVANLRGSALGMTATTTAGEFVFADFGQNIDVTIQVIAGG
jgi:hypothetical protein